MTPAQEDTILALAEAIKDKHFKEAEEKWAKLHFSKRERPWPRCYDVICNRTLICRRSPNCRGFDF